MSSKKRRAQRHAASMVSHRSSQTPEEANAQREREAASLRSNRESQTPEEVNVRRERGAASVVSHRSSQTPEEANAQRERDAEYQRVRRRERSPEGHHEQNRRAVERMRNIAFARSHEVSSSHRSFCDQETDDFSESKCDPPHEFHRMRSKCRKCGALMWPEERIKFKFGVRRRATTVDKFSLCCQDGKYKIQPIKPPTQVLRDLLDGTDPDSGYFLKRIRLINSNLAFAGLMADEKDMPGGHGPPIVRMHGAVYHVMGALLPSENELPKFMSLYIYDPDMELENRLHHSSADAAMKRVITKLQAMMHACSPLIEAFKTGVEQMQGMSDETSLRLVLSSKHRPTGVHRGAYNTPKSNSIAAIMPVRETTGRAGLADQSIVLSLQEGGVQFIKAIHPLYDALHYVLFRPFGDLGWSVDYRDTHNGMSLRAFCAHQLMYRPPGTLCEHFPEEKDSPEYYPTAHLSRRLFQQWIVDQAVRIEDNRLFWVQSNQESIRSDMYQGVCDALDANDMENAGRRIILPSTFSGSLRSQQQHYQDSLAIVLQQGQPSLFITLTCNPQWKEITAELLPGQKAHERPDLVARVFRLKFQYLMYLILERDCFGKVEGYTAVIEFQKRGLPHTHVLIILCDEDSPKHADAYDHFVSAEIPSTGNPRLRALVLKHMVHGPCGILNARSPCMVDGKCSKKFPKQFKSATTDDENAYPEYRRRSPECGGETAILTKDRHREMVIDNSFIVPYNPALLLAFQCHVNIEIVTSIMVLKYLFLYVTKVADHTSLTIEQANNFGPSEVPCPPATVDEIKNHINARFISESAGCWSILSFPLQIHAPAVMRLPVHLPGQQQIIFDATNQAAVRTALERNKHTMLTEWFQLNITEEPSSLSGRQLSCGPPARELRYCDIPRCYTWQKKVLKWRRRLRKLEWPTIGRMYNCHPLSGERYFLRRLLHYAKGAKSFSDLYKFDGEGYEADICETLQGVCARMGLLEDDREWDICMTDASQFQSASLLRRLFCVILLHCEPQNPLALWHKFKGVLCEDVLHNYRQHENDSSLPLCEEVEHDVLVKLNAILADSASNKTVMSFGLPEPGQSINFSRDFMEEANLAANYDRESCRALHEEAIRTVTEEQARVLQTVFDVIYDRTHEESKTYLQAPEQSAFFLEAPGGTGKTFVVNALINGVRARGWTVIPVASSGLAALLMPGGRTAHSRFKIPLNVNSTSRCFIQKRKDAVLELLIETALIVWDEAPMQQRAVFETVDRTLRDLLNCDKIFGGIPLLLCGDFQQILPVVPRGSRAQIVEKSLKSSPLWSDITVLTLTKNMRVHLRMDSSSQTEEARLFNQFLFRVGHGIEPVHKDRGTDVIQIPSQYVSTAETRIEFFQEIYPNLSENIGDKEYLSARAILSTKNDMVDKINAEMLDLFPGDIPAPFLSADSVSPDDDPLMVPDELLNSLTPSGLPPHKLYLKVRAPIILLRNLDPAKGACNGTRLTVTQLTARVIEAEIITGSHSGERIYIPRCVMTPSDNKYAFVMRRRQFPVRLAFAMTINKSQGQTFKTVGIYLPRPVFTHGQLYVALSRVGSPRDVSLYIENNDSTSHCMRTSDGTFTDNIVFRELFCS